MWYAPDRLPCSRCSLRSKDAFETIAATMVSKVTLGYFRDLAQTNPVAIKSAHNHREFVKQPHDIGKELRFLMSLSHVNVRETICLLYKLDH